MCQCNTELHLLCAIKGHWLLPVPHKTLAWVEELILGQGTKKYDQQEAYFTKVLSPCLCYLISIDSCKIWKGLKRDQVIELSVLFITWTNSSSTWCIGCQRKHKVGKILRCCDEIEVYGMD